METDLIHDRGRGPEIKGTRMTVYNLLEDFLDPAKTEGDICYLYELTPEQVAAARSYVLRNPDTVLAGHLEIEARMAAGNPPEVIERAKQTQDIFVRFKTWLDERDRALAQELAATMTSGNDQNDSHRFPTFREWLTEQRSRAGGGS
jgi:uncharacterized protein (DUF433 family)